MINNSDEVTTVDLPAPATVYALSGEGKLRSRTMTLNGKPLVLGEGDELPALLGVLAEGKLDVAPGGCTFIVI